MIRRRSDIIHVFCEIESRQEMLRFFNEIFSAAERKDLALRWELMKMLFRGVPQRTIASNLGISLCKITRGAKIVRDSTSVTRQILKRLLKEDRR